MLATLILKKKQNNQSWSYVVLDLGQRNVTHFVLSFHCVIDRQLIPSGFSRIMISFWDCPHLSNTTITVLFHVFQTLPHVRQTTDRRNFILGWELSGAHLWLYSVTNVIWTSITDKKYIKSNVTHWMRRLSDIWAIGIKLSVIVDTFTYLCYTDKKSPIL